MKNGRFTFAVGMLTGAVLFSGVTAYAAGVMAEYAPQRVYVDGASVQLEAYNINGYNYVKLRDIGEIVDFNVYWDGSAIQIDSGEPYSGNVPVRTVTASTPQSPEPSVYTISAAQWSREDFSQEANPAVFTATYDRALYNTIRQTLVDGTSETPAYTMVDDSRYSSVKNLLGRLEGVIRYEHYVPQNFTNYWQYLDYFAVSAETPENYQEPLDFIRPAVAHAGTLASDRERVEYLNDYLRALLAYETGKTSGITQTFAPHTGELPAACGSYARAMKFLCAAVDIPCFTISSNTHTWNLVYVDGRWLHVDVSANDLYGSNSVLLTETYQTGKDQAPEATAFLKELYVPGSTK